MLDSEEVEVTEEQRAVLVALSHLIARVYDDRRRKDQLRDALYRLQHATEDRQRLVERIASDVAEPVEAIAGLASLLVEHDVADATRGSTIEMIGAHAFRLRVLLEGLVQAETGAIDEPSQLDVSELVEDLNERGRGIVGPELGFEATGAGTLIAPRSVLTCLLEALVVGAAHRTTAGTVSLEIAERSGGFTVDVSDPGRSLTDAERADLIDGSSETSEGRGVALGDLDADDVRWPLVMARRLAASFGAEMSLDQVDGTGTRVRVSLPAGSLVAAAD